MPASPIDVTAPSEGLLRACVAASAAHSRNNGASREVGATECGSQQAYTMQSRKMNQSKILFHIVHLHFLKAKCSHQYPKGQRIHQL
ncbi:hypothetical protein NDU88_007510 [Pleurodeles waltl]|uniref:Uncharacterized protein n=1 Tax=Pleurodeles waltl TaxID=8319 RepID=A0AAV7RQB5_PLEWA|nr:hypothetical protein NDU88_007510 [Pleurodeles waltl]